MDSSMPTNTRHYIRSAMDWHRKRSTLHKVSVVCPMGERQERESRFSRKSIISCTEPQYLVLM